MPRLCPLPILQKKKRNPVHKVQKVRCHYTECLQRGLAGVQRKTRHGEGTPLRMAVAVAVAKLGRRARVTQLFVRQP